MAKRDIHVDYDFNSNQLKNFRLEHLSADPEPLDGSMYYNTELKTIRVCTDGKWSNVSNSPWLLENDTIVTDLPVHIKNNLLLDGDEASMGDGEDNSKGTVRGIKVSSGNTLFPETDGIVDMTEFFSELSFDVDLSGYYTSQQIDTKIGDITTTTDSLSNRIGSIETLIGEDKDTIEGTIDTFYEIEHFLSGIGNTTLNNIIEQFVPKTTKIAQGTGISVSGDGSLSSDVTISLMPTGVTAGTYTKVTVDQYGRATSGSALLSLTDVTGLQAKLQSIDSELTAKVGISNKETITGAKTFSALATFNEGMSIKGDVTIDGNLFITGDEASMGEGGSGTGGGIDEAYLETYLSNNDYIYGSINGGRWANNIFAPTTGGTSGYVLVSNGSSSAPVWKSVNDLGISGGVFEGGYIPNMVWFANGQGIVTYNSKYNIIHGDDGDVRVGSSEIPCLLLRASTYAATVIGTETITRARASIFYIAKTTLISQRSDINDYDDIASLLPDFYEGSTCDLLVNSEAVFRSAINFYRPNGSSHFRIFTNGGVMSISVNHTPSDITKIQDIAMFSSSLSYFYSRVRLMTSANDIGSALQIYANSAIQNIGIDANNNLIYNDNIIIHAGNYEDYIVGYGTITGVKMNGVFMGTSGVVDLGTVITAHQDLSHLAPKNSPFINNAHLSGNTTLGQSGFYSIYEDDDYSLVIEGMGGDISYTIDGIIRTTGAIQCCGLELLRGGAEESHVLDVDSNDNLTYNSNVILHSGNYSDYISGGSGADLSDYYTKTEVDSGFVSKNNAIQYIANNMRLDLDSTNQYSPNYISFSRSGTMIGGIGITAATNVLFFGPNTLNYITVDTDGPAYTKGTDTYRILHSGNYTDYVSGVSGDYLPTSGGSIDGNLSIFNGILSLRQDVPLYIYGTYGDFWSVEMLSEKLAFIFNQQDRVIFNSDASVDLTAVNLYASEGNLTLGLDSEKNLAFNGNIILHSGNYSDFIGDVGGDYLPLSGGILSGPLQLGDKSSNWDYAISLQTSTMALWYIRQNLGYLVFSYKAFATATSYTNLVVVNSMGTQLGGTVPLTLANTNSGKSVNLNVNANGELTTNGGVILHSGNYTDYISESGGSTDGGGSTAGAASPPMMVFTGLDELSDFTENGIANGQVLLLQTTSTVSLQTVFKTIFPKTDSDGNRLSTTIYIKARSGYETGRISVPVYRSSGIILSNPSSTGAALNNSAVYTLVLGYGTIMLTHCGEYWVANLIA